VTALNREENRSFDRWMSAYLFPHSNIRTQPRLKGEAHECLVD
jgi:hypothetical protein